MDANDITDFHFFDDLPQLRQCTPVTAYLEKNRNFASVTKSRRDGSDIEDAFVLFSPTDKRDAERIAIEPFSGELNSFVPELGAVLKKGELWSC